MRKNVDASQKQMSSSENGVSGGGGGVVSRSARNSFRALSNCIRVISSGASTVARSAASAASAAVNRDIDSLHDQVLWAGFDKLEREDGNTRRVLLLAFQSGFQVWDVEETEDVHVIVSAYDGHASFMQMLLNPINSKGLDDKFSQSRPLMAVCADSSWEENPHNQRNPDPGNETFVPTNVHIYSLKSQSYVHMLKFRSIVYTVRCSSRIVAVLQSAQIHCFNATTLEMEYTILTNSIVSASLGVGYGPLAVGPRWIAFSGKSVTNSSSVLSSERISLSPTVVHYAKESSKQLASGIVTLGDKGYKTLSRYCSEILPGSGLKGVGVVNDQMPDEDSVGMVIIRDIISKRVISQFKAHKSPISALCFDPSGILLLTASVQGHNINVFRIMPRTSSDGTMSALHLFKLQRGFTNAVIQDISFSNDSNLIMISSSRGTSHLFEIDPSGDISLQRGDPMNKEIGYPVHLSAINRIRSGNSGWIGTMTGAAAAATGIGSSLHGAVAASFCNCTERNKYYTVDNSGSTSWKSNLLVFAPTGSMIQYALKAPPVGHENAMTRFEFESGLESEGKLAVEPLRMWVMFQNKLRKETQNHNGTTLDSSKVFPEVIVKSDKEDSRVEVETHQLYMSEAELHMYQQPQQSLWDNRKFRFQELVLHVDEESNGDGEIEIERIKTLTIEPKSRNLVPVFNYIQSPRGERSELISSTAQDGYVIEYEVGVVHNKAESLKTVNKHESGSVKEKVKEEERRLIRR